jgi:hypothetical protein
MVKLKKSVVSPDLTEVSVESVVFHRVPRGVEMRLEGKGKKQTLVPVLDEVGNSIPLPPDQMARVRVRIIGEDGRDYPSPGATLDLCFYADRGSGEGGMADALVANPKSAGYMDLLQMVSAVAIPAVYSEVEAAYRRGKTDEEGRANVAEWLLETGRLPG